MDVRVIGSYSISDSNAETPGSKVPSWAISIMVVLGVLLLASVAVGVYLYRKRETSKHKDGKELSIADTESARNPMDEETPLSARDEINLSQPLSARSSGQVSVEIAVVQ